MIAQDLWRTHDRILLIIFLKDFIQLNVNMDTTIKNAKLVVFHTEYATVEYTNFKDDLVDISEGIVKTKCKYGHNDKKCETCGISYEVCNC